MKLKTIWTIPKMSLKERIRRTQEWIAIEIALHLPASITYWVFMTQAGKATQNTKGPIMATRLEDLIKQIDRPAHIN